MKSVYIVIDNNEMSKIFCTSIEQPFTENNKLLKIIDVEDYQTTISFAFIDGAIVLQNKKTFIENSKNYFGDKIVSTVETIQNNTNVTIMYDEKGRARDYHNYMYYDNMQITDLIVSLEYLETHLLKKMNAPLEPLKIQIYKIWIIEGDIRRYDYFSIKEIYIPELNININYKNVLFNMKDRYEKHQTIQNNIPDTILLDSKTLSLDETEDVIRLILSNINYVKTKKQYESFLQQYDESFLKNYWS